MAKVKWRSWDVILVILLVGSVAVVFWHAGAENTTMRRALEWLDAGLCVLFVAEWAWRAMHAPKPGRWALLHSWELLGMVPIVAPVPSFLRILRLARLVRILRVFGRLGKTLGAWERIAKEGNLHTVALVSGTVTLAGSFLVWLLERDANPEDFSRYGEALWWAIVTVTTVGYGDITPATTAGRVVAAGLMVTGIGTIGLLASSLASVLVRRDDAAAAAPPTDSFVADLKELSGLRDADKLTDDEYAQAKAKLLR